MDTVVFLSTSGLQMRQEMFQKAKFIFLLLENMPLLKERW